MNIPVDIQKFGRIAAQTAKQVVIQGIREAERGVAYESYSNKAQELMTGTVLRIDPTTGDMFLRIGQGNDTSDAVLQAGEQIPGETHHEGDMIRVYVLEVRQDRPRHQLMPRLPHPSQSGAPPVRAGDPGDRRRSGGDPQHRPGSRFPFQDGSSRRHGGHRPRGRLRRPSRRTCGCRGEGTGRREDRHCGVERRPLPVRPGCPQPCGCH